MASVTLWTFEDIQDPCVKRSRCRFVHTRRLHMHLEMLSCTPMRPPSPYLSYHPEAYSFVQHRTGTLRTQENYNRSSFPLVILLAHNSIYKALWNLCAFECCNYVVVAHNQVQDCRVRRPVSIILTLQIKQKQKQPKGTNRLSDFPEATHLVGRAGSKCQLLAQCLCLPPLLLLVNSQGIQN